MRARNWTVFILINVIVSVAVIVAILFLWKRLAAPPTPTPAPTLLPPATETALSPPTALPATLTPSPAPLVYTVQAGDTLSAIAQTYGVSVEELMAANAIADPNVLQVGQVLIIPNSPLAPTPASATEPSPTAAALPTLLPTLTPSSPPLIEIGQVLGSGDLAAEVVIVRNRGGVVSLKGWTLSNAAGNAFTLPALTLFTDAEVRIHSAAGDSTPTDLYWGRASSAWMGGELITLRDAAGNVVSTYIVP